MIQAEIDLRVMEQRLRDRQEEMAICRLSEALKATPSPSTDVFARLQSFMRHLRPSTSARSTVGAAS